MRKFTAILLSVMMVLSLALVGVSAEDATVITTAEQFLSMAADGNYKLGANITLSGSYGTIADSTAVVPFTGTLDGDSYTVTVSAPVFETLSGTVKNLFIKGSVTETEANVHAGGLARLASGTVTLEKVVNEADIYSAYRCAGLISQVNNGSTLVVTDCRNYGKVTATASASMVGGLIGYVQGNTVTITDCANYGDVIASSGNAGGIVGRLGGDYAKSAEYIMNVTNCINEGKVTSLKHVAGGIVGFARSCTLTISNCTNKGDVYAAASDAAGILASSNVTKVGDVSNCGNSTIVIDKCVNYGNVESLTARAGGVGGYCWCGTGANSYKNILTVRNCVNYGTMTGKTFASQMFCYANSADNVIENNIGLGQVKGQDSSCKLAFYGFSSAAIPAGMTGNKLVSDGSVYYTYTASSGKEANIINIENAPAASLATVTKADAEAAVTALGTIGCGTLLPLSPRPAPTPDPDPTPSTGDSLALVAVIALVSVFGMGVALKSRKDF